MTPEGLQIPLAELIQALRRELVLAVAEGTGEHVRFALGPVELELQVAVAREAGGEAGVHFWVVAIGGKGTRSTATTHTVKLSLTPFDPSASDPDAPVIVGSREAQRPK